MSASWGWCLGLSRCHRAIEPVYSVPALARPLRLRVVTTPPAQTLPNSSCSKLGYQNISALWVFEPSVPTPAPPPLAPCRAVIRPMSSSQLHPCPQLTPAPDSCTPPPKDYLVVRPAQEISLPQLSLVTRPGHARRQASQPNELASCSQALSNAPNDPNSFPRVTTTTAVAARLLICPFVVRQVSPPLALLMTPYPQVCRRFHGPKMRVQGSGWHLSM